MDPSDVYPEPFGEALSYSSQRLAQLASLVTAGATVHARRKAQQNAARSYRREQELRALQDQERAAYELAQAGWAPANDPRWLAQADLLQAARAWSTAAAYADADPGAADAARKCEERLRVLHPYAMAWYDRLREEGADAFGAMREAISLFARAPHARPGDPGAERRGLFGPDSLDTVPWDNGAIAQPDPDPGLDRHAEQRGDAIVRELQDRILAERGYPLSPDELMTMLGATTTLPGDLIARLAHADAEDQVAADAERDRASDLSNARGEYLTAAFRDELTADRATAHAADDRSAAQLAAESFPCTVADVVTAASSAAVQSGPSASRVNTVMSTRRPGRSA